MIIGKQLAEVRTHLLSVPLEVLVEGRLRLWERLKRHPKAPSRCYQTGHWAADSIYRIAVPPL